MAETIALTHHEKWDGTGYPFQLTGEHIPLVGRICALSDVFDALVEIKKGKNKHFDPKLVDVFEEIFPSILEIREKFTD